MRFKNLSYLNRKGPRYIRQRSRIGCGPVCLVNLKKWLGYSTTYKDVAKIERAKIFGNDATWQINLLDYLDSLDTKATVLVYPEHIRDIDKYLKDGAAVLLYSSWKEKEKQPAHISLIISKKGRKYRIVNYLLNQSITSIDRDYLIDDLKTTRKYSRPQIWAVYKKEEKNIATV